MKSLDRLSQAFNGLRNAAITRSGAPQPGVSPELADWIAQTVEAFRGWAGGVPFLIDADDYDHWEDIYSDAAARLTRESKRVVATFPKRSDLLADLGKGVESVATSGVQAAALALAGLLAVMYLVKKD